MSNPHFVVFFKPSLRYFLLGTLLFFGLVAAAAVVMGINNHFNPPYKAPLDPPYTHWTPDGTVTKR